MGKYKAYSKYKDSGVEWMEDIPEHWVMAKTSRFFKIGMGQTILKEDLDDDGEWPVFSATEGDHYLGRINNPNIKLDEGDIVIPARGNSIGSVKIVTEKSTTTQTTIYCKPYSKSSIFQRYAYFYLNGQRHNLFRFTQTAIPQITTEEVGGNPLILPTYNEQIAIASFLDHETAKIDTLIEQQQQLIQLLKEKRQAVISHAVTKGLNPNAPMKDSGVEWLGEVPAHWGIKRFKFLCDQIIAGPFGSSITKDMYVKDGYKVYGQEQVIPNDFSIGDYYISEKNYLELSRYIARPGDILISCVGTFGKVAVFPKEAEPGIINPRLIKAQINGNCDPYYLRELLKSEMVFKQFELLSRGGTMGVINIAILNEIIASVPPLNEQRDIVVFINEQECKFDHLLDSINKQIEFSQERRTALISAAVTGKIDVRNWQAPQQ